nr:alpha-1B-glycoprotein isoform X4 [Camelus dromedarius]
MSTRAAFLLLWGLALGRVTEEAVLIDTRANLWAEAESLLKPGAIVTLTCQSVLRTQEFQLFKDGVPQEPVRLDSPAFEHRFLLGAVINDTRGLYRCRYSTDGGWMGLSNLVELTGTARLPPPTLTLERESSEVLRPGSPATLTCVAPLSGVDFQLRRGEEVLQVLMSSTSPDRIFFHLDKLALGDSHVYTCRYRLHGELMPWSLDSAPAELVLSDGTLPAPELSAEPAVLSPKPGTLVQLQCWAPRTGVRFALVRENAGRRLVHSLLSPAGTKAHFELHDVSVVDSANYSCIYTDTAPPFAGSAPSARVELRVDGPLPKPQLRPLWRGAVTPGRDAVLRCEGEVPDVTFELLRVGEGEPSTRQWAAQPSADLVLTYVGPQHTGSYSCRYRSYWPNPFQSELSDPVELQVAAGSWTLPGGRSGWLSFIHPRN